MTTMDIARALKKVQDTLIASNQSYSGKDKQIHDTAEAVGAPYSFVLEHLNLLEESDEIQKALEEEKIIFKLPWQHLAYLHFYFQN